jgi:hypothetical protein
MVGKKRPKIVQKKRKWGEGDRQGQGHRMGWSGLWGLLKLIVYDIW